MSVVHKSKHDYFKKKQQLKILVLLSFVVIFIIWFSFVGIKNYSRDNRYGNNLSEIIDDGNKLNNEFAEFKTRLDDSLEEIKKITSAENKKRQVIDGLRNKIEASAIENNKEQTIETQNKINNE